MMNREQLQLLKEIMAVDFSAEDMHLFLDTHPCDQRALTEFKNLCQQSQMLRQQYQQCYATITPCDARPQVPWSWIEMPWPWQIDYGRS